MSYWSTRDHGLEPRRDPQTGDVTMVPVDLTGQEPMTFGHTYRGQPLQDVPGKYWTWFLSPEQSWAQKAFPALARYARRRLNIGEDGKPLPRKNSKG